LKRKHAVDTPRLFTSATLAAPTLAVPMHVADARRTVPAAHKVGDCVIAPFKAVLRECVV